MSDVLARLEGVIAARRQALAADPALAAKSHAARLLAGGPPLAARKLGEEAIETVVAALAEDDRRLASEAADLVFHLLVLLAARGVPLAAVFAELARREGGAGTRTKEEPG